VTERLSDIAPRLALARDQWEAERRARIESYQRMGAAFEKFALAMDAYAESVGQSAAKMALALGRMYGPRSK
jgi:hypothetical protein